MSSPSNPNPTSFSREVERLTVREFELFREAQARLEDERESRLQDARVAMERLIDVRLLHLKAEYEARFVASDQALALAEAGNQKHLEALNGEQARLLADRERFVSADSYNVAQKEFSLWRDQVNAAMNLGAGRDRGIGISWSVVLSLVGMAGALIGMVLALMR